MPSAPRSSRPRMTSWGILAPPPSRRPTRRWPPRELHARRAQALGAPDDGLGGPRLPLDPPRVDPVDEEGTEALEERLPLVDRGRVKLRLRGVEAQTEAAEGAPI